MATLVLGTIGRAVLGPVGGIVGTFVGGLADRAIFGGGGTREGARLANLAVQSSAYGEPIPRLYGRFRVAGNLIWTSGIAEHVATAGGGKRGGARTTSYSYSASFAVALSARPIAGVGRVWADGRLLRNATGAWLSPALMRIHGGADDQPADPLIAAAEVGGTPAYRGLAYAVFEDLALADFGNRIPNLTFEVVADPGDGIPAEVVVADLAARAGIATDAALRPVTGFAAARGGSVRAQLGELAALFDLAFADDGDRVVIRRGDTGAPCAPLLDDLGCAAGATAPVAARRDARAPGEAIDDALALGFFDPSRDFQPGLQRVVRRTPATRAGQLDTACALDAAGAKALAAGLLARRAAARATATLALGSRWFGVRAGATVVRPGDAARWTARRWTLSDFVLELEIERRPGPGRQTILTADAGRGHDFGDTPPGRTTLAVFEALALDGAPRDAPRVLIGAAGAAPGWRRAAVAISRDGGETYSDAVAIAGPATIGRLITRLDSGPDDRWDRRNSCEVELLGPAMWLESRSDAAVLAGANLALIANELMQFAEARPLGGRHFRLSGFLRGRRGSGVAAHPPDSSFTVLDTARLLPVDLGAEAIGTTLRFRATGGDGTVEPPVVLTIDGRALRPLAPVFLRRERLGGDDLFSWIRRSRAGFAWVDGADAPLGEARERYRVTVDIAGSTRRVVEVDSASWIYTAAARAADGLAAGTIFQLTVAQLSETLGPGTVARAIFTL